jgi:hypothetical protein
VNAPPPRSIPFGKHANEPLPTVPADYLDWLLRTVRVGSGLRAALVAELARRGVEAPPSPPPRPLPSCPRCPGVKPLLHWLQDSLGRRRIRVEYARCHGSLVFAPTVSPYVGQAERASSATPILDVLTRLETIGVELLCDGRSVWYRPGDWQRVPPDLRRLEDQCRHELARMLGRSRCPTSS